LQAPVLELHTYVQVLADSVAQIGTNHLLFNFRKERHFLRDFKQIRALAQIHNSGYWRSGQHLPESTCIGTQAVRTPSGTGTKGTPEALRSKTWLCQMQT
jgi:hypothetical protein